MSTNGIDLKRRQQAWYYQLLGHAMLETTTDAEAVQVAHACMSLQPLPPEEDIPKASKPAEAAFSFDLYSKAGQGILNRAMEAVKKLTRSAREELMAAFEADPSVSGQKVADFLAKYRTQLAALLSSAQLASVLEGAREVARHIAAIPSAAGAVPPPPSLPPDEAQKLLEQLRTLPLQEQRRRLYEQPADWQRYLQQQMAMGEGPPDLPPIVTTIPGEPERVHLVTIEKAVEELSRKNVVSRAVFDRLDQATRAKSFTVAGVETDATLTKIRDALAKNVEEGVDLREFRKKVLDEVSEGTFLSDAHLETVFRTNVQGALSDGQMAVVQHPLVRSGFPYAAIDSIADNRRRFEHGEMEKQGIAGTNIFRLDDPVFQTFRGPWDFNCRCGWRVMTIKQAAEEGVASAQRWLETGTEPDPPDFVPFPPWRPPPEFQRAIVSVPSLMLSLQPLEHFLGSDGPLFLYIPDARPAGEAKRRRRHRRRFLSAAFAVVHAPKGGLRVQGKFYPGGEFIPSDVIARATPEEKRAVGAKSESATKQVPEAKPVTSQPTRRETDTPATQPVSATVDAAQKQANERYAKTAAPVRLQKMIDDGINETSIVVRPDGSRAVFKPIRGEGKNNMGPEARTGIKAGTYWIREIVASRLARAIEYDDLIPETSLAQMEGNVGSAQTFVAGRKPSVLKLDQIFGNTNDFSRAAVLDYLMGHQDRHFGNWMVTGTGKFVLIDNGLAFPSSYDSTDFMNLEIMHQAERDNLPLPNVSAWNWDRVAKSLEGLDDQAIALTKERFDALQAANQKARAEGRAMTFADLPGWGGGTAKELVEMEDNRYAAYYQAQQRQQRQEAEDFDAEIAKAVGIKIGSGS